jgi:hypothetical protein
VIHFWCYNGNLYDMSVNVMFNLYFTCENLKIQTLLIWVCIWCKWLICIIYKIKNAMNFSNETLGLLLTTSFIYGHQNDPMVDIVIIKDSILIKQCINKWNIKDFGTCQLYIVVNVFLLLMLKIHVFQESIPLWKNIHYILHPYSKQLCLGGVKDELKDIAWNWWIVVA